MKHLLSILILLGFMSLASAEEIYLSCKGEMGLHTKELDINLDKQKMWLDDYLFNMFFVRDDLIVAKADSSNEYLKIDRLSGYFRQWRIEDDGSRDEFFTANCERIEKLF